MSIKLYVLPPSGNDTYCVKGIFIGYYCLIGVYVDFKNCIYEFHLFDGCIGIQPKE